MRLQNDYTTRGDGCNLAAAEILGQWRPIVAASDSERTRRAFARLESLALGDLRGRNFAACLVRRVWRTVRRRCGTQSRAELLAALEAFKNG